MRRAWIIALTLAGILAQAVSAQVVSNSAKAMGIGGLN